MNGDDCGYTYLNEEILPTDHFRSCALYKKEIHKKVEYEDTITPYGFREEQFFSFRCIVAGYKLGVHTGAISWHLVAPSGGERRPDANQLAMQNQILLNRLAKKLHKEHGDFIEAYHKNLGLQETEEDKFRNINKNNNLIYSSED